MRSLANKNIENCQTKSGQVLGQAIWKSHKPLAASRNHGHNSHHPPTHLMTFIIAFKVKSLNHPSLLFMSVTSHLWGEGCLQVTEEQYILPKWLQTCGLNISFQEMTQTPDSPHVCRWDLPWHKTNCSVDDAVSMRFHYFTKALQAPM